MEIANFNPSVLKLVLVYIYGYHMGGWRDGGTVQAAYNLNVPLYAKLERPHKGNLPTALCMVHTDRQ